MYSPWIVAVILTDLCHGKALTSKESIMDETVFSNPLSFDYNFDDDVRKPADIYDVYDELVPHLPGFVLHKNGKDIGYARVPIVTRRLSTWSTPPPRHRKYENYDAWTPAYYRTSRPKPQVRPLSSKSRSTDPKALHQKANSRRTASVTTPHTTTFRTTTPRTTHRPFKQASKKLTTLKPSTMKKTPTTKRVHTVKPTSTTRKLTTRMPFRAQRMNRSKMLNDSNTSRSSVPTTSHHPITTTQKTTTTIRTTKLSQRDHSKKSKSAKAAAKGTQPKVESSVNKKKARSIAAHPVLKPPIIHSGDGPYRGPTFNCRVLIPARDGKPSKYTDKSCVLIFPGFPADQSCRCTYEVSGRDASGCATGYVYSCSKK